MKFLAIYADDNGEPRAAILTANDDEAKLPFGVDVTSLGLKDYNDGGILVLVELGADDNPMVIDVQRDEEIGTDFINV